MGKKVRIGVAGILVAGMSVFGVGCSGQPLTKQQQQNAGNFIFLVIYMAMCQANYGNCPFPLGPTLPPPSGPVVAPPAPDAAPVDLATG